MKRFLSFSLALALCAGAALAQDTFRLHAVGDVQVGDAQEFAYADKSVFQELLSCDPGAVNLFLGDQVNDDVSLLEAFRRRMDFLPQENWVVIGNHDRDVDSLRVMQEATFNRIFGPSVYARRKGRWHFLVLNNVYGTGPRAYKGHLPEEQVDFIRDYVSRLGRKERIVLCMHIPLAFTDNRDAVLSALEGRDEVLAITGHMHEIMRHVLEGKGVTVHEVTAGATCGIWWRGEQDWDGVPMALMQGGAPRGYFVFDFTRKGYSFRFKGVGLDEHRQMTIGVSGVDACDREVDSLRVRPAGSVYTTIYGAFEGTEVRYRVDDGPWMTAVHVPAADVNVARVRHLNHTRSYPTAFSTREPLRLKPSRYVWQMQIPDDCRTGVHLLSVEASDPYGFSARGARTFSLDSAR